MIPRILLAFSILIHTLSGAIKINKCCPRDEVVHVETFENNLLSPQIVYSCVKNPAPPADEIVVQKSRLELEPIYDEEGNATAIFMGYNALVDHASHWPACGETPLSIQKLNEPPIKSSQLASCADLMDDGAAYYVFTCEEKLEVASDLLDVYKLRKCCTGGMSYDIFARKCVVNNETDINDNFRDFLPDKAMTVLFEHSAIKCNSEDEVLVEYHSHVHDLKMYESSLVITTLKYGTSGPEVFARGTYCIDSTMNSEAEQPDGMSDEHFRKRAASKFIAKVCRNKTICSQIPCVRKCCRFGERMTFENATACEPYDTGIEMQFHSFDIQQTELQLDRIEPSGEFPNLCAAASGQFFYFHACSRSFMAIIKLFN
jgi:hypothetical protein